MSGNGLKSNTAALLTRVSIGPKARHHLGDHGLDIRGLGQVGLNGDRLPTRCLDLGRNALGAS